MDPAAAARLLLTTRWARVTRVRPAEAHHGGPARQWLADVEDADGAPLPGCLVLGARRPIVSTPERPSWGMWGTFAGNITDRWFLPCPAQSASVDAHRAYELLDEFTRVAVMVHEDGTWSVRSRPGSAPRIEASPAEAYEGAPTGGQVRLMGGTARLARREDYVALTPDTSPEFFAWMAAVSAALGLPNPIPQDAVPAVDDFAGADGVPQVVGRIVTSSPYVKGR